MADKYNIDSHKLHFHPDRTAAWLQGECIYPIYMEVSPSGACNHRCVFCGKDFMGYRPVFLDTEIMKRLLTEMGQLGLKSIMYAGEGEPFLHKDMASLAVHTKQSGIDVAFTTNGVPLTKKNLEIVLPVASWIKISCNAGTAATYADIHGTSADDFERVMSNLANARRIKEATGSDCTLGVQMLLLPENGHEAVMLANRVRDAGADYFVVKPYSHNPKSQTRRYKEITYGDLETMKAELHALGHDKFNIIFRSASMKLWDDQEKGYDRCYGLPFWAYIDSEGNVWGCSMFLKDERFHYGNVHEEGFQSIWQGEKRRASLAWVENELDPASCRVNCRMDAVNRYLWGLRHPSSHVNFI